MNKIERVTAVLEGRRPDRTPVSFWCHFAPDCAAGAKAVEAHVRHVETFNILHVCGTALNFARFADYPVHVLHWADRLGGPSIAEVAPWARPALCAGLDNLRTMVTGSPADCAREVRDAIQQAGTRPILVAPGCTYDPAAVPAANLHAIRRAVEGAPLSS